MRRSARGLVVVVVVALAASLGLASVGFLWQGGYSVGHGATAVGPNNGWNMMSGRGSMSWTQIASYRGSQPAWESNDTIAFSGASIDVMVLMGPMSEGTSMYTFVVDNLSNPTLIFPEGARVTMTVVNIDTDAYHGLALTSDAPPYSSNVMTSMMYSSASTGLLPPSSAVYAAQRISFAFTGVVYYVCPVPGHAQLGMYGVIEPA